MNNGEMHSIVMMVEDNDEDFYTALRAFKKSGLRSKVIRFETGEAALEYLEKCKTEVNTPFPNVILLDLNLPGADGEEILQQVKADRILNVIPIIILSSSSADVDIENCYKKGANSYIQKPVSFKGYVEALSKLRDYWFDIVILPKVE